MRLRDACMVGPVDLETIALLCPFLLKDFYFDQPINLNKLYGALDWSSACVATGRSTSGDPAADTIALWLGLRGLTPHQALRVPRFPVVRRHPEPPHHRFGPRDRSTCPRGPASQNIVMRRRSFCVGRYSKPTGEPCGFRRCRIGRLQIMVKDALVVGVVVAQVVDVVWS